MRRIFIAAFTLVALCLALASLSTGNSAQSVTKANAAQTTARVLPLVVFRRRYHAVPFSQTYVCRTAGVVSGNEKSYVDHGEVHRAHTPRGKLKVLRKINGIRISSLGFLSCPNYRMYSYSDVCCERA